ncbi:dienelactone hydrolase family protein [Novosphingobium umbonatum]|nr:dienelactone hydrolase family protein [Novosphingobium umbonatum]
MPLPKLLLPTLAMATLAPLLLAPAASAQNATGQNNTAMPSAAEQAAAKEKILREIIAFEEQLGPDTWRQERFKLTPRKHEMVHINANGRRLNAFVIYPEKATPPSPAKVPVVMLLPEDQGLNIWARDMADQVAAMGVIVVVPDIISGQGPNGGGRDSITNLRDVFLTHFGMAGKDTQMSADLNVWADYAKALPQANGKLAVLGFAWGAGRGMYFALQRHDLSAVYAFYDAAPPPEMLGTITAPLYGFYAQNDARPTRSLPATIAAMKALGKTYEPVIYPNSDHMFMRLGEEPREKNPGNAIARAAALLRLRELLGRLID